MTQRTGPTRQWLRQRDHRPAARRPDGDRRPRFDHRLPADHDRRDFRRWPGWSWTAVPRWPRTAGPPTSPNRPPGPAPTPWTNVTALRDPGRVDHQPGRRQAAAAAVLAAAGVTGDVAVTGSSVTVTARATKPAAILAIVGISQVGGTATATAIPLHGTTTGAP